MNVTLPDGTVIQDVPDGTTKAQLLQKLQANNHPAAAQLGHAMAQEQVENDPVSTGARNFAKDMPWWRQAVAGYGKAIPDMVQGIGQMTGLVSDADVDETKKLDAPLMKTGGGITGNIAGTAAAYAPTAFIPGANTIGGAGIIGAAGGAIQPVGSKDATNRVGNAALGAGAGMTGQVLGRALGRAVRPVQPSLNGEEQQLAQAAMKEGIPLTAGQQTGSRPLQIAESVMENLPLTSAPQLAQKEAQQRAFTAAVLRKGGMSGDVANAGTLLAQKQNLGSQMGDIAKAGKIDFNQGLTDRLAAIVDDASTHLPPDSANKVSGVVDKVLSQVDQSGNMAGTNYQGWREPLRGLSMEGAQGNYMSQIRKALDNAFSDQAGDAYKPLARQYANTKTIINAMGGPGALPATGQVAPSQLGGALARSIGRENKALGMGDLNDLSRIGQTFVKDQIPNSGTAQRQFIQSLLTTGGGSLVGGAAAAGTGHDPIKGAAYGAGVGLGAAALPKAIQTFMNSPAGQAYLTKGIVPITQAGRDALANILRTGALGAAPALSQ